MREYWNHSAGVKAGGSSAWHPREASHFHILLVLLKSMRAASSLSVGDDSANEVAKGPCWDAIRLTYHLLGSGGTRRLLGFTGDHGTRQGLALLPCSHFPGTACIA